MHITLYQIDMGRDENRLAFCSLDRIRREVGQVPAEAYEKVFEGDVDCASLEEAYLLFNRDDRPGVREFHSMSVSDVVAVRDPETGKDSFHFCDTVGFEEIDFDPELTTDRLPRTGETIRVVLVEPGKEAQLADVDPSLEGLYKAIRAEMIEPVYHQGKRSDLTSVQFAPKLATEQIAADAGTSKDTIKRYIRLTNLIPDLLDQMDEGRIAFSVGVELSYLDEQSQYDLLNSMERNDCTPSYSQAVRLHRAANAGTLNRWLIETTLEEQKPNQKDQIRLRREDFRRYFPSGYTDEEIRKDILAGLALLHRQRERDRDAR